MDNNIIPLLTRFECIAELEELIRQLEREMEFKTYFDLEITEYHLQLYSSILYHIKHR